MERHCSVSRHTWHSSSERLIDFISFVDFDIFDLGCLMVVTNFDHEAISEYIQRSFNNILRNFDMCVFEGGGTANSCLSCAGIRTQPRLEFRHKSAMVVAVRSGAVHLPDI